LADDQEIAMSRQPPDSTVLKIAQEIQEIIDGGGFYWLNQNYCCVPIVEAWNPMMPTCEWTHR